MSKISEQIKKRKQKTATSIHVLSYRLLNDRIQFLYPRLASLEQNLKQAMVPIPFDVYICSMIFFSLIGGVIGAGIGIALSFLINIKPAIFGVLLPILVGGSVSLIIFFVLKFLPILNLKNRASRLTEELPHFISYMATLATSGLSLEGIFKTIANEDSEEEIVKDCRFLTRNIEVLGMDLVTAINDLIKRSPKGAYSELLEGSIITVQTGGDLKEYLISFAKVQMEEKKMRLTKSTESLGVMAEMYTIMLIVFPLMAIIMLSIMALMSPDLGGFDLMTIMNLLTYVLVPFFGVMLLFMMDSMVPKR